MSTAEIATYAYHQIDQARAALDAVSKWTTYATPQGDSADRQTVLVVVSHLFVSEIVVSILALHAL